MMGKVLIFMLLGYAVGSVLPGYWLTRWLTGKDIRTMGDLNPGAANVFRTVGRLVGAVVAVFDIIKGAAVVAWAREEGISGLGLVAVGAAAVMGHVWPLFMGFDGGAGGSTILGVALVLFPKEVLLAALAAVPAFLWGHRLVPHREVPATVVLALVALVAAFVEREPLDVILGMLALVVFVGLRVFVWRHRRYQGRPVFFEERR